MDITTFLAVLGPVDLAAIVLIVILWLGLTPILESERANRLSVGALMADYRREWMRHAVTREPRVYDSMIVTSLRDSTTFFASATMIAIGGGIALIGNIEQLSGLAQDLDISGTKLVWEVKLMLPVLLLTNAFLKFVWSNRLFGYCSVMMGAVPNDTTSPETWHRAEQAAELNISAAKAFNRGLRSVYFALGSLAWLLGGIALILASMVTAVVILRREYASHSRRVIMKKTHDG